jgi:siroheme synthase
MMARAGLAEIAAVLIPVVGGARPAAVIAAATLPGQRSVSARLDGIARAADDAGLGTPATLFIGEVVTAIPARSLLEATVDFQFG